MTSPLPATWDFAEQLRLWGPEAAESQLTLADAQAYTRWVTRTHYENFPVVSWLLPRRLRQPFYDVYAYCRWSDDLGDEVQSPELAERLLDWWEQRLRDCFASITTSAGADSPGADVPRVCHPVFLALRETIAAHALPIEPFLNLLSAFRQDQRVREYATYAQLLDYCQRSANPVGELVLRLAGCWSTEKASWSDAICSGLQLANFWQDVGRDYAMGRIYLPREDRVRFGYTDELLARQESTPEFRALLEFEVDRARKLLESGRPLLRTVPRWLRVDLSLFLGGGLTILKRIQSQNYAVWERRPKVTKGDVLRLLFTSCCRYLV